LLDLSFISLKSKIMQ